MMSTARIYNSVIEKLPITGPFLAVVKDLEHRCCWITDFYAKQLNLKSHRVMIGKKDADFLKDYYTEQFYNNDKIAFRGDNFVGFEKTIWQAPSPSEIILQSTKCPLYDDNDNIIGSFSYCVPIMNENIISTIHSMNATVEKYSGRKKFKNISLQKYDQRIPLSPREAETLYYTLQGMTSKKIGRVLGISPKTVEYYLSQLKIKFNCHSKNALIEKSIENNYLSILPQSIFDKLK